MTIEELRLQEVEREKQQEKEEKRLKEKVLCVEITLPAKAQNAIGVTGFMMKLSELAEWLEEDYNNDERGVYTIKIMERTNKWIESLPEADI